MDKTTPKKLSKRIAQYGSLATIALTTINTQGQILYTDENPDFSGGVGSEYFLDVDNNGTDDFKLYHQSSNLYIAPLTANNNVLGSGGPSYVYPFALSSGDAISNAATTWNNNGFSVGAQSLAYNSSSSSPSSSYGCDGNWCGGQTDKYLGLQFNISGAIHYGWVRLDVSPDSSVWSVKDFAFNNASTQAITAGQNTLAVSSNVLSPEIKIITLNKSITLTNLKGNTSYSLFDLTGKELLQGTTNNDSDTIDASAFSSGVYLIKVNETIKKIVL